LPEADLPSLRQALAAIAEACEAGEPEQAAALYGRYDAELRAAAVAGRLDEPALRAMRQALEALSVQLSRQRETLRDDMQQARQRGRATRAYLGD